MKTERTLQNIRELLKDKKVSIIELANHLGKNRQSIYDLLNGKVALTLDVLYKIADILKVSPVKLIDSNAYESFNLELGLYDLMLTIHTNVKEGKGLVYFNYKVKSGIEFETAFKELKEPLTRDEESEFGYKFAQTYMSIIKKPING